MKRFLLASLSSIFFLCSCIPQNAKNDNIYIIPIAEKISKPGEIKCSIFVNDFEYIQLETNEKCLIPDTFNAIILKKYILIYGVKYCFVFDRQTGKFLYEISKYGAGPNEYQSSLIAFDHSNSLIYSLGWHNNSLIFDLNGKYQGNFPLPSPIRGMENPSFIWSYCYLGDSILVGYYPNILGVETKLLSTFKQNGKQINVFPNRNVFPKRPLTMLDVTDAQFYQVNNETYFKERSIDTVFNVNAKSLKPHAIFTTDKFSVPYEYKWWTFEQRKNVDFIFVNKIIENSNWIIVQVEKESVEYFGLYNKLKAQLTVNKKGDGIPNDIDNFVPFSPQFMDVEGNPVEFITALKVSNWFKENPSKISDKIKEFKDLDITQNPLVMIGKSKTR